MGGWEEEEEGSARGGLVDTCMAGTVTPEATWAAVVGTKGGGAAAAEGEEGDDARSAPALAAAPA